MNNSTPYIPFTRPYIDEDTIAAVGDVLRSGWITTGPKCAAFEKVLSEYFGGRPVRCFANGTATMEIALRIAGIGPGDEVITTPISWVSTSNVILTVGATPVFVDIDPVTRNIDLNLIEAAITPSTKAILPVYLAGLPVDIERLYQIADKYQLRVIEDAAQALGSKWKSHRIGSNQGFRSDLVSFSFQANKNLTSVEGGCLVMNTEEEANLAQRLRLQGVNRFGMDGMTVDVLGGKHNMTDVNAIIGLKQFERLDSFTTKRKELSKLYASLLQSSQIPSLGLELPVLDFEQSNWHMFQVLLPIEKLREKNKDRAYIMQKMMDANIGTGFHYPVIADYALYKNMGYDSTMTPHAQRIGASILTLPLFTQLEPSDITRIVSTLELVLLEALR